MDTNFVIMVALLVGLIGGGALMLFLYTRTDSYKLLKRSVEYRNRRFSNRDRLPVGDFVAMTGLSAEHRARAEQIIREIADVLKLDPELLRPDDEIEPLFHIYRKELTGPDVLKWQKLGCEAEEELSEDLVNAYGVVEEAFSAEEWGMIWLRLPEGRRPEKDAEKEEMMWPLDVWDDTLRFMTFREMLLFMYDGEWPERLK